MSDYREASNLAKAKKLGIVDARPPHANRKKAKVRGPWKVVGSMFGKDYIYHHCATEEMAQKMINKRHFKDHYRIEHRELT